MPSIVGSGIRVGYSAVLLLAVMSNFANAQAFQNLDFEQTQIELDNEGDPTGYVTAFPGWTLWPTTSQVSLWGHLGIQPQNFIASDLYESFQDPLAGHFSVYMENGFGCVEHENPHSCDFGEDEEIPIAPYFYQTGLVPASAQSIRLKATPLDPYFLRETQYLGDEGEIVIPGDPDAAAWRLYMNGHEIHVYDLGDGNFGSNIPSFAGTTATLSIRLDIEYQVETGNESGPPVLSSFGNFDSFQFSTTHIVPEPTACLMGLIGLVVCVLLKRSERSLSR